MALQRTAVPPRVLQPPAVHPPVPADPRQRGLGRRLAGPIGCMAAVANRPAGTSPSVEARHRPTRRAVAHSYLDGEALPVPVGRGMQRRGGARALADDVPRRASSPPPADRPHAGSSRWRRGGIDPRGGGGAAHGRDPPVPGRGAEGPFVLAVPVIEDARGAAPPSGPCPPRAVRPRRRRGRASARSTGRRPTRPAGRRHAAGAHHEWATGLRQDDRRQPAGDHRRLPQRDRVRRAWGLAGRWASPRSAACSPGQRWGRGHPRRDRAGGRRRPGGHHPGVVRPAGRGRRRAAPRDRGLGSGGRGADPRALRERHPHPRGQEGGTATSTTHGDHDAAPAA